MNTDRRQLRATPNRLVFIQLDHASSGKVLNLSEQIEAVGEIAWTDASRKVGGMRFLEVSQSALNQIRKWISQNSERSEAITTAASANATELVPLERYRSATRRQFIRGVFLGVLITSALAVPAVKYSGGRIQLAAPPRAGSGQTALANSEPQARVSVSVSASNASRGSLAFPAGKTQRSTQAEELQDNSLGSTHVKQRLQAIDNPSAGNPPTLSVALAQSRETRTARKSVASPQQLWSAVQGGNVQAALTLADLYLRGDGVPVNCDQARVLLLVASKKGNAQAVKELRELDRTGCPTPAP